MKFVLSLLIVYGCFVLGALLWLWVKESVLPCGISLPDLLALIGWRS